MAKLAENGSYLVPVVCENRWKTSCHPWLTAWFDVKHNGKMRLTIDIGIVLRSCTSRPRKRCPLWRPTLLTSLILDVLGTGCW